MPVTVRPLIPEDHARWIELWHGYLTFYGTTVPDEITQTTWRRLLTSGEGHDGFAALNEAGEVIGITHYLFHASTWSESGYCYLEDLFVHETGRGSGAGRALIAAVEEVARQKGCTRLYLNTQEFNETARTLYDKVMTLTPFVQYRKPLT